MNTYDRITERIIDWLNQGTIPWHKTWKSSTGLPRNLITDIRRVKGLPARSTRIVNKRIDNRWFELSLLGF